MLDLIAQSHNNARIAKLLFVSPKTVRNHISNIFTNLQIADRTQAILRARATFPEPGDVPIAGAPTHGHEQDVILRA